ncbi:anti-sigma B factor antagonist [Nonomuraea fuscirosea]|uniref:Anti-sigma factor antagonist n=1 Tax=Nonomuraea fuscirosea TaxID=1291556 RepID=A0A2T0MY20_9ACTN|nr:anti-sigma B factor antagonist [Nonomuraea fuscirosea]
MTGIPRAPFAGTGASAATIVHLSGEIDIFTSTAVRLQLLNALRHSTKLLIFDLSQVSFCDSSGLAVLVGIQHRARAQNITLALANPRSYTSHVLRVTGLDRDLLMMA